MLIFCFNSIQIHSSDHAAKHGYSVSDELSGHGIGKEFHCYPLILHHGNPLSVHL